MKNIGEFLRDARLSQNMTLQDLEKKTRIRKEFIESIEKSKWDKLPDFAVVLGFVKNIASYLDMDEKAAVALLRRDYPPQNLPINPKPDVDTKSFSWTPRLTFIVGVVLVVLGVGGYLAYQYKQFVQPPLLEVTMPTEGETITKSLVHVEGRTDPETTVRVNNQPVLLDDLGVFTADIEITEDTSQITIKAISRSGKETVINRTINPEFNKR